MENHPIPQDVTGFKFKLIGSVTVKQFLYLLGFGILTTVMFVLHINLFIKVPFMLIFASIGAALAFIPIEGRPMDVMIANFAKTIPAENRFIYKKRGVNLASYEFFKPPVAKPTATATTTQQKPTNNEGADDKRAALISRLRNSSFRPDADEVKNLNNIHALFEGKNVPVQKLPDLAPSATTAQGVMPSIATIAPAPTATPAAGDLMDTAKKEEQLTALDKQLAEEKKAKEEARAEELKVIATPPPQPKKEEPTIRTGDENVGRTTVPVAPKIEAPTEQANPTLSAGFPTLPDVPNVILGIVRDARGRTLPNILVEVVDANNIPVRAFKTNALGQFASATPLSNGTYHISLEDASKTHEFKMIEVNLAGDIFQPLEIVSTDAREKLRQELFGGNMAAA